MVVETGCRFHREIAFPDVLDVGIRVRRLGTSSVTYEIGIFRQGEEAPAATGHFVHVYVLPGTMKAVPIPDSVRQGLQRLLVHDEVEGARSEEHTSALQSIMRLSYAVFCLK